MQILLVNDDGIFSPGLAALADALTTLGQVTVVAPSIEQSGVGHTITFQHPVVVHREHRDGRFFGWKVDGSPADCTKLGILELSPLRPDLIVSGINHGANVGINVLYSGTVAAAIEGAFFGIPSIAVSQSMDLPPDFPKTARQAVGLIRQLLDGPIRQNKLWNINFPASRGEWPQGVRHCAIEIRRINERVEKRLDPRGRTYFWSGLDPLASHHLDEATDVQSLLNGWVTITPLHFDLTERPVLERLGDAVLKLE